MSGIECEHAGVYCECQMEAEREKSQRLAEALKFYEDVENWHCYKDGKRIYVHTDMPESFAVMDYGKRAKEALREYEEKK